MSERTTDAPDVVSSSDAYARRFAGAVGALLLDAQRSALAHHLARLPPGRVLDVGGGHAQLVGPLRAAGHRVTVLGSRPGLHQRVRRVAGREVACVSGDLEAPPFAPRSFDLVLAFRMLAHVADWRSFLAAMCRVARHAVLCEFPARSSVNVISPLLFAWKRRIEGDTRPFRVLPAPEVIAVCRRAGFGEVSMARELLLPLALHRAMRSATLSRTLEHAARATGLTRLAGSPVVLCARRPAARAETRADALLSGASHAEPMAVVVGAPR